ncbi:SGNH/GDSL hydrolase family protein [Panacibacter sp. DH6]|uniref:SGNH/GDSL hydrolase family protein n=1 Tax=Panacibacter microcysteis TaxID=2793269 RepID=A0A931H023_9BACT|nr:SGNH/GDSL hydrolase family protein [Panacibacter microcysteis]MBG9378527.1 SGNH/GDSL hydrolase family protein [Panacibacter microcysteis]
MIRKFAALTAIVTVCTTANAQVQPVERFKKGDRIAFTGNSITDGGHYHSYIWLYYMTRFPNERIDVFNSGIGGDVAEQIYKRMDDDIFVHNPNIITLTFGMNDVGYYDFLKPKPEADSIAKERIRQSYESYQKIEQKLKAHAGIKKILIVSSPYDETVKKPNNYFPGKAKAMLAVAAFQQASAEKNRWGFIDFNRPMTAINEQQQQRDSTFTLCGGDRIHPGNDGHMIMAYVFLKSQGLANKPVADISINASGNKVNKAENCTITNVVGSGKKLSFNYLAKSLPYPLDTIPRGWMETKRQSDALAYIPFMQEFNKEQLQVAALQPAKQYKLNIDGKTVGTFSGEQLASGINMAAITTTPQYKQALALMYLNEERWEIERRFRMYYWLQFSFFRDKGLLFADNEAALDTLDANMKTNIFLGGNRDTYLKARFPEVRKTWKEEMALLINKIYTLNKPVNHVIEVVEE